VVGRGYNSFKSNPDGRVVSLTLLTNGREKVYLELARFPGDIEISIVW